ncbi:hypothetical protein SCOCK_630012 [Actinacidiphila cocklensis]|uniref:Uncharacterized protein n=1 Tax=Actinacidiphila cocklensis TaxID=887465 RepID=A0A9W4GV00_9ACTN|nr:hypothetical protein SCOCK_630012 [Actinacidiphila cocklensis]
MTLRIGAQFLALPCRSPRDGLTSASSVPRTLVGIVYSCQRRDAGIAELKEEDPVNYGGPSGDHALYAFAIAIRVSGHNARRVSPV